ncbi:MAG: hypothetical protein ABFD92_02545 [Planctomycetaceae bacterium]|nr:hypothetical protein [Planctomycetaceae bacterium]
MGDQTCSGNTCGTCAFWRGQRAFKNTGEIMSVTHSAAGTCTERWRGFARRRSDTCSQWQQSSAPAEQRAA